jgi:hypothetical protein
MGTENLAVAVLALADAGADHLVIDRLGADAGARVRVVIEQPGEPLGI